MSDFQTMVQHELEIAKKQHPAKMNSLHEGFAVLLEELDEFKAEVFKKARLRSKDALIHELVQVGAMAQRMYEEVLEAADQTARPDIWRGIVSAMAIVCVG